MIRCIKIEANPDYSPTAREKDLPVHLHAGPARELVPGQVGVVAGLDEVVAQRGFHVVCPQQPVK